MNARDRERREDLKEEIAIGRRVDGVAEGAIEAELTRRALAIEGEGRRGERGRAKRRFIHALSSVDQAAAIALEPFDPGHQMMSEADRLSALKMGIARHEHRDGALGAEDEHAKEAIEARDGPIDGVAHIKPHIGRDLIVSAPCRMELAADRADGLGEGALDVHMNVFAIVPPLELTGLDAGEDAAKPFFDGLGFALFDDALGGEHPDMRDGAADILWVEALV